MVFLRLDFARSFRSVQLLVLLLSFTGIEAGGVARKYLIASSPSTASIAYLMLPNQNALPPFSEASDAMRVLVDTGLRFPQGLAVDEFRNRLFVADPGIGKLVFFDLSLTTDFLSRQPPRLQVGSQQVVADGVETRAVAVDGLGNVFFTDESSQKVIRMQEGSASSPWTMTVVYDGSAVPTVSTPGGIAMDNFFVYWLNKASGQKVGSLIRGLHGQTVGGNSTAPVVLASNAEKCYGVCIASGNVFYTDERTNLYGIPRASTAQHGAVVVSSLLQEPRGCAFDGLSTLFVADKGLNSIFTLPANMQELSSQSLTKVASLSGAFGVAVYTVQR